MFLGQLNVQEERSEVTLCYDAYVKTHWRIL